MTDQELLEFAALAAGETTMTEFSARINDYDSRHSWGLHAKGKPYWSWNPLEDDGDALKLAAKLNLWEAARIAHRLVSDKVDIYDATRLSIVLAAAEIGKSMAAADAATHP